MKLVELFLPYSIFNFFFAFDQLLRQKIAKYRIGAVESSPLTRKSFDLQERESMIKELETAKNEVYMGVALSDSYT